MTVQLSSQRKVSVQNNSSWDQARDSVQSFNINPANLKAPSKRRLNKQLRQFLATAVVGGALIATPQVARAVGLTGSYTVTQSITSAGAVTATADGAYNVNTTVTSPYGDALDITSGGAATYSDAAATVLNAGTGGTGLNINSAGAITITSAGTISGESGGISAVNTGTAATAINTSGVITGTTGDGIFANMTIGGGAAVTVITGPGSVTGGKNGIHVENFGTAASTVIASGAIKGGTGDGIYVNDSGAGTADLKIETIAPAATVMGVNGIRAINNGTAGSEITIVGNVTGTAGDGIFATNASAGSSILTIEATNAGTVIHGSINGINATNNGVGATTITSTGSVTGGSGSGIVAESDGTTPSLTIEANNSSGGTYGISATNKSSIASTTEITTTGIVAGGTAGIHAESSIGGASVASKQIDITVAAGSTVRNISDNSADLAVDTTFGATTLTNSGIIKGGVKLSPGPDATFVNTFDNNGTWNAAGSTSSLGLGADTTLNNSGIILAAKASGGAVTTTVNDVNTVNNSGDIVMQNADVRIGGATGVVGDVIKFTNADGTGSFVGGAGSNLLIDTSFTSGSQLSDQLWVDNASGVTTVNVNVMGTLDALDAGNVDGILVVNVTNANTGTTFITNSSITVGSYTYVLKRGTTIGNTENWYLWNGDTVIVPPATGNDIFIGYQNVAANGAIIINNTPMPTPTNSVPPDYLVKDGGHLHLGTNNGVNNGTPAQTITGDGNTITNRVLGVSGSGPQGSITVTGAGSILGLGDGSHDDHDGVTGGLTFDGSNNSVINYVGRNGLDPSSDANYLAEQLDTVTAGGKVLLGGRTVISDSAGNLVSNIIEQNVTLGDDTIANDSATLELAGVGAGSTTGPNAATVNNIVDGNVEANGTSKVSLYGSDGDHAFNRITGQVTLNNSSFLIVTDGGAADGTPGNTISGGVVLNDSSYGNVGAVLITGDGTHNGYSGTNPDFITTIDWGDGTATTGISNSGSGNFSVGGGSIGNSGTDANGNQVTNNSNYVGTGDAVDNSGTGDFTVGNGLIYGNGNIVDNSVTGGDIQQTGSGSTIVGGMKIHGDNNTVTASVGDINATNGTVRAEFNTLYSSDNHSTSNLGHQTISGAAVGHYGDGDVTLPAFSDRNSDTINIDGLEVDNTGAGGASAFIGGGRHTVTGDDNKYRVNVNTRAGDSYALDLTNGAIVKVAAGAASANTITGINNTFANTINGDVNVASGSDLTLFGGNNSIIGSGGSNNEFINKINGDVTVDGSSLTLDAGAINASNNPSIASDNSSGNTITGDVTLTNSSQAVITGQTTDVSSGSNSSFNTIGGTLDLTDSTARVTGHNNNMNVNLDFSGALVYSQDITGQSGLTLENSITGDVTVNNSQLIVGTDLLFLAATTIITGSNNNTIDNTVNGTVTIDSTNGGIVTEYSELDVTGNKNHVNNTLKSFSLNSTNGSTLVQGGYLTANGTSGGNEINNTIIGDVVVDGANNVLIQRGGVVAGADRSGSGGSSAGYSASDGNGNQITNTIDGHVTVQNDADFLIDGERNIVTGGVADMSSAGTHIGGGDVNAVGATINNESTADHTVSGGGRLHLGTNPSTSGTQTVTGSNNTIHNRVIGDSGLSIEGSITVTGAGSTLGLGDGLSDSGALDITGGNNTIYNEVRSAYTASGNAQLQTVTNRGEVRLGGRKITSNNTGNVVNNIIDQNVTLGANSGDSGILFLLSTGAGSTTGANAATVNNTVIGDVEANGSSFVYLDYSDGVNAFNKIDGQLTLNDNSNLRVDSGGVADTTPGNIISGGVVLNDSANGNLSSYTLVTGSYDSVLNTGTGGVKNTGYGTFSVGNRDVVGSTNITATLDNSGYTGLGAAVQNTGGGTFLVGANGSHGIQAAANGATADNTSIGDVSQSNGSDTFLNGRIDGSANDSTFNNTIVGNVTSDGGVVGLGGSISNGAGDGNSITNTITGAVDMTDGTVTLGGTIDTVHAGFPNFIYNDIQGDVDIRGTGQLNFQGDLDASDNNPLYNAISNGSVTLHDTSTLTAVGTHNYIANGLLIDAVTASGPAIAIVGGSSDTTIDNADVNNSLVAHNVTVSGNPYSYSNAFNGFNGQQQNADHSYNIDSGHVIVGAAGGTNIATGHSITNTLDADVTLNGNAGYNFDGTNNWLNSGGLVVLGGASNTLNTNASVTNEITGNVDMHGGSRLYLGDETITGDGTGSVTNVIGGTVTADGNSFISLRGDHDPNGTITNTLSDQLNTYDNVFTRVSGGGNEVTNGVNLHDNSELQLSALSGWAQNYQNQLTGSVTLYNQSNLILGNDPRIVANPTMDGRNRIVGNVTTDVNSTGAIKVLSGGAGGFHGPATVNEITGNLTMNAGNNFDTYVSSQGVSDAIATGIAVGGTSTLNSAVVRVVDIDPININNGHADFTFGRRHTLVQAVGGGSVANGFNPNAELYDVNNNSVYAPALNLTTGYNSSSAYLDWLTDFYGVANTTNQQNFGAYLDGLVDDSNTLANNYDGIDPNSNLGTLLNYLVTRYPIGMGGFMGDTYSAFDMVGYHNTNYFVNSVATHARQSHDNDWTQTFALNAQNGLSGAGAQMSLVKQLLNSRPTLALNANGNNGTSSDPALWAELGGHWLRNDGDSRLGSPDWNQNTKSLNIGYQGGDNSFSWGITGGYHDGNIDFNNRDASGKNDGWNAGLNGLWKSKSNTYVNGVLAYGHESNSLTRNDGLGTNKSDFSAKSYAAMLEIGKRIDKKTYNFTPYASLMGVKYKRDGLNESGSGAGLSIDSESHSYLTSALGVRIGRDYLDKTGQKKGGVMLGVNWQHQFSGTNFPVRASLTGIGGSFTTYGTPLSSDSVGVQLGAYGRLSKSLYGFVNYSGNFSSNQKVNSITAGLQYGF